MPLTIGTSSARHASRQAVDGLGQLPSTTSGRSGLPKFRQSVTAIGSAPRQARLRAASATAMARAAARVGAAVARVAVGGQRQARGSCLDAHDAPLPGPGPTTVWPDGVSRTVGRASGGCRCSARPAGRAALSAQIGRLGRERLASPRRGRRAPSRVVGRHVVGQQRDRQLATTSTPSSSIANQPSSVTRPITSECSSQRAKCALRPRPRRPAAPPAASAPGDSREHHLVRRHARSRGGDLAPRRSRCPRPPRAAISTADDWSARPRRDPASPRTIVAFGSSCQAGLEQQLLQERVADLHARAAAPRGRPARPRRTSRRGCRRGRCRRRPAAARLPGPPARARVSSLGSHDADAHRVDERVPGVARVEVDLAADRRDADAVAVVADARRRRRRSR